MTKTYYLTWKEWVEYCTEHGIDPHEHREDGYDLGGGHSFTVMCREDPPEAEYKEPEGGKTVMCKCYIVDPSRDEEKKKEEK